MQKRNCLELLKAKWAEGKMVCVGLDGEAEKLPACIRSKARDNAQAQLHFNKMIVSLTKDIVCAYKPNIAFSEAELGAGITALKETVEFIHEVAPDVPIIIDAKRADIGNTNTGYVKAFFDQFDFDGITLQPYLGGKALQPFLDHADKLLIILCKTSNPDAGEFQDRELLLSLDEAQKLGVSHPTPLAPPSFDAAFPSLTRRCTMPLYEYVARRVTHKWNANANCGLVVGATYPHELKRVREIVGDEMPILVPGIGTQGGNLRETVLAGRLKGQPGGMIINSSSGIIFASSGEDFAEAARRKTLELHNGINEILSTA